jgi:hypothetical protein
LLFHHFQAFHGKIDAGFLASSPKNLAYKGSVMYSFNKKFSWTYWISYSIVEDILMKEKEG